MKPTLVMTEWKEVAQWNKGQKKVSKGHWYDLLQYRIHMAWQEYVRCPNGAYFSGFSCGKITKCDGDGRERGSSVG
jgi:hypothetical protein